MVGTRDTVRRRGGRPEVSKQANQPRNRICIAPNDGVLLELRAKHPGSLKRQARHQNALFNLVNVMEADHSVVADWACGSAGMFVQSSRFIETSHH